MATGDDSSNTAGKNNTKRIENYNSGGTKPTANKEDMKIFSEKGFMPGYLAACGTCTILLLITGVKEKHSWPRAEAMIAFLMRTNVIRQWEIPAIATG